MDVLLTRDQDLLRLVFKVLDVVVDVEYVFVELGEVVELRRKKGRICFPLFAVLCYKTKMQDAESVTSFRMVSSKVSTSSSFSRP